MTFFKVLSAKEIDPLSGEPALLTTDFSLTTLIVVILLILVVLRVAKIRSGGK